MTTCASLLLIDNRFSSSRRQNPAVSLVLNSSRWSLRMPSKACVSIIICFSVAKIYKLP